MGRQPIPGGDTLPGGAIAVKTYAYRIYPQQTISTFRFISE